MVLILFVCDCCGKITDKNYVRTRPQGTDLYYKGKSGFNIEITSGVGNCWNDGELCLECIEDLVLTLIESLRKA